MPRPTLTFACELERNRLVALFADNSLVDHLRALDARVALMLSDFSAQRASVVERLNAAQIPVVGIPLMPYEEGYYYGYPIEGRWPSARGRGQRKADAR